MLLVWSRPLLRENQYALNIDKQAQEIGILLKNSICPLPVERINEGV